MIDLLFKNGHLIDPASGIDRVCNLGIRDGKSLGAVTGVSAQAQNIIDASGYYIFPGLVDFHTHIYTGNNARRSTGSLAFKRSNMCCGRWIGGKIQL